MLSARILKGGVIGELYLSQVRKLNFCYGEECFERQNISLKKYVLCYIIIYYKDLCFLIQVFRRMSMRCVRCNNILPENGKYCLFCGKAINEDERCKTISNVDKGYSYLEIKEWKKARKAFDLAIVNNDNKSKAYIGRLLARLKIYDISSITNSKISLTKYDEFNLALKYADDDYKDFLQNFNDLTQSEINLKRIKRRKLFTKFSISLTSMFVICVLIYYAFIPLFRINWYKNRLSKGDFEIASISYKNSKWFEYNDKVNELFYVSGIKQFNDKQYNKAVSCFENIVGYKDSEQYYNYANGKKLLSNNNLDAYNYFSECLDFLDSSEIIEKNQYLKIVKKLQGIWHQDAYTFDAGKIETGDRLIIKHQATDLRIDGTSVDEVARDFYDGKLVINKDKVVLDTYNGSINFKSDNEFYLGDNKKHSWKKIS